MAERSMWEGRRVVRFEISHEALHDLLRLPDDVAVIEVHPGPFGQEDMAVVFVEGEQFAEVAGGDVPVVSPTVSVASTRWDWGVESPEEA